MKSNAFIKIPRFILSRKYSGQSEIIHLFIYIFGNARFSPDYVHGIYVNIGEFIGSEREIAEKTGIPRSRVKKALQSFEEEGLLKTERINNRYTKFTVLEYGDRPAPSTMLKGYYIPENHKST